MLHTHRIITTQNHNYRSHFHYSHLLSNWVCFKWKKIKNNHNQSSDIMKIDPIERTKKEIRSVDSLTSFEFTAIEKCTQLFGSRSLRASFTNSNIGIVTLRWRLDQSQTCNVAPRWKRSDIFSRTICNCLH